MKETQQKSGKDGGEESEEKEQRKGNEQGQDWIGSACESYGVYTTYERATLEVT